VASKEINHLADASQNRKSLGSLSGAGSYRKSETDIKSDSAIRLRPRAASAALGALGLAHYRWSGWSLPVRTLNAVCESLRERQKRSIAMSASRSARAMRSWSDISPRSHRSTSCRRARSIARGSVCARALCRSR